MLKKIASIFLIVVISFSTGAGVCYCYCNLDMNQPLEEEKLEYRYCSFSVEDLEFENSVSVDGAIEISEDQAYIDDYTLYYSETSPYQAYVKKGDLVEYGTPLGYGLVEGQGASIISKTYGKVVDIHEEPDEQCAYVKVLNYDALYFTVSMKYDQAKKFNYDSDVYYYDEKGKKVFCKIALIGYEIMEDKTIQLHVVPKERRELMPGMKTTITFVIDKHDRGLALMKDAVVEQSGNYTVLVKKDGGYEEKTIKVGNMFEVSENESVFYYYPILDGLKAGDVVYMKQLVVEEDAGLKNIIE